MRLHKSLLVASGALSLLSILFLCVSVLTPGWRKVNGQIVAQDRAGQPFSVSTGLFGFLCSETDDPMGRRDKCLSWAHNIASFERVVLLLCALSLLGSLLALSWAVLILSKLVPDLDHKPQWILPAIASVPFVSSAFALVVYFAFGCSESDNFVAHWTSWSSHDCSLGYSFFLALLGCVVALLALSSGLAMIFLSKRLVIGANASY